MEQHLKHVQSLSGLTDSMKKPAPTKKKRKPAAKKSKTVSEQLTQEVAKVEPVIFKPKRTRRSKAQMEADAKAKETPQE